MTPSSNSFSKKTLATGANSFTDDTPETSSNSMTEKELSRGSLAWEGDNLTSGASPGDMISGDVFGIAEAGGIAHRKRERPEISH